MIKIGDQNTLNKNFEKLKEKRKTEGILESEELMLRVYNMGSTIMDDIVSMMFENPDMYYDKIKYGSEYEGYYALTKDEITCLRLGASVYNLLINNEFSSLVNRGIYGRLVEEGVITPQSSPCETCDHMQEDGCDIEYCDKVFGPHGE